ncbi:MAG: MoxR family ATPase [Planctomycetia bacterium]|nr:MoxR family ATPase [Planctomycetia bacterium]
MPDISQLNKLAQHIGTFFLGKTDSVRMALVSILAEGHILVEDVPGIGKTLLARVLAKSLRCSFHRVQFTPDLLPSDLTGAGVFHQPTGEFQFRPGPIFANMVLADEINRATPRTQSALLEAMGDGAVSVDGETRQLDMPFIVIATQNPYEFEGTYALPENQLDRFAVRIRLGYPPREIERAILTQHREGDPADRVGPVLEKTDVIALQKKVREVRVDDAIADYLLAITEATRARDDIHLGVSTRGALTHYRISQAHALMEGRDFVTPDDVKKTAVCVLGHRIVPKVASSGLVDAGDEAIAGILQKIPVPI